jgi:hypothetical protein
LTLQVGGKNAFKLKSMKVNVKQQKLLITKYTIAIKGMLLQILKAVLQEGVLH